jgi:hypothetical protein
VPLPKIVIFIIVQKNRCKDNKIIRIFASLLSELNCNESIGQISKKTRDKRVQEKEEGMPASGHLQIPVNFRSA